MLLGYVSGFVIDRMRRISNLFRSSGPFNLGVAFLLAALLVQGLIPMSVRWPVRIMILACGLWGFIQTFFVLKGRSSGEVARAVAAHPFSWMILIVGVSMTAKEFFPLSNYPMYSDPQPTKDFYYLGRADENGDTEALPVGTLTKLTPAKSGKVYKAYCRVYSDGVGKKSSELDENEKKSVAMQVLDFIYSEAARRRDPQELPGGAWRFVHVEIAAGEDGLIETETVMAEKEFATIQ